MAKFLDTQLAVKRIAEAVEEFGVVAMGRDDGWLARILKTNGIGQLEVVVVGGGLFVPQFTTVLNNATVLDGAAVLSPVFNIVTTFASRIGISALIAGTGGGAIDIEYSIDNATWRNYETIPIVALQKLDKFFEPSKQYYRFRYTDTTDTVDTTNMDLVITIFPVPT